MTAEGLDLSRVGLDPGQLPIDKPLDPYATERMGAGREYRWWWNADGFLAEMIAAAAHHILYDGCHAFGDAERDQLKTLARYFTQYAVDRDMEPLTAGEQNWLYAEAMWLLSEWMPRLWD